MATNDTSITLDIGASGPDDQYPPPPYRSKNDILMNMIRQQKETLEERDKSINELLDKIERDRKTIAAVFIGDKRSKSSRSLSSSSISSACLLRGQPKLTPLSQSPALKAILVRSARVPSDHPVVATNRWHG